MYIHVRTYVCMNVCNGLLGNDVLHMIASNGLRSKQENELLSVIRASTIRDKNPNLFSCCMVCNRMRIISTLISAKIIQNYHNGAFDFKCYIRINNYVRTYTYTSCMYHIYLCINCSSGIFFPIPNVLV